MAAGFKATTAQRVADYAQTFGPTPAGTLETVIDRIIEAVSDQIEVFLHNKLQKAERIQTPSLVRRWQRYVHLVHAPIDTGQTVEIREAADRDFTPAATVIDGENYHVDSDLGVIIMDKALQGGAGTVQITTTGGLADDTDGLETNYPSIVVAATQWAAEAYWRRKSLSTSSRGGGRSAGSVTYNLLGQMPRHVLEQLLPYQRKRFGP